MCNTSIWNIFKDHKAYRVEMLILGVLGGYAYAYREKEAHIFSYFWTGTSSGCFYRGVNTGT
jgi:hypothetical protein